MTTKKMDKLVAEIKRNVELCAEVEKAAVGPAFKRDGKWTKLKIGSNLNAVLRANMLEHLVGRIKRLLNELNVLTVSAAADAVYKELETVCPGTFVRK